MTFGEFIRQKRIEKGMGMRELSEMVGIAPSYLSDIEKGNRNAPNEDTVECIMFSLGLINNDYFMALDLAADTHEDIPADIKKYLLEHRELYTELRKKIYNEPVKEV